MGDLAVPTREYQGALVSWAGAASRAADARSERLRIIDECLKKDLDYGTLPGTDRPALYKAGAEKVNDSLNLYPDYEALAVVEDFDSQLFHYRYKCILRSRSNGAIISTGIGSCNSRESKYRWRMATRACTACGNESVFKSKNKDEGWYCWEKKGGCGQTFAIDDPGITTQIVGKVESDDVASQVNTIDKMGQKRALVAATLNLGFSEQFTQDLEDMAPQSVTQIIQEPQTQKAAPVVRQPQATPKEKPAPARPQASQGDDTFWSGIIKSIKPIKRGTNRQGPWTLYLISGEDGQEFSTFDGQHADFAQSMIKASSLVGIKFELDAKGYKNMTSIGEVAPTDERGSEEDIPF